METSYLLARIIGPYMLIAAIGLYTNRSIYDRLIDDIQDQPLLFMVTGAFTLILGLLMLQFHNVWSLDWRVLVTLIGWLTLIKGALAIIAPQMTVKIAEHYKSNDTALNIQATIIVFLGVFMSYMGYFA
ncbi:MAG: hypothetical protein GY927_07250 [bacterium]|nr:hypothetical protein [bacterium]